MVLPTILLFAWNGIYGTSLLELIFSEPKYISDGARVSVQTAHITQVATLSSHLEARLPAPPQSPPRLSYTVRNASSTSNPAYAYTARHDIPCVYHNLALLRHLPPGLCGQAGGGEGGGLLTPRCTRACSSTFHGQDPRSCAV